jgi:hypothetical protein
MADAAFVRAGLAGDSGPEPLFERAVLAWRQGQIDRARDLLVEAEKRVPGYFVTAQVPHPPLRGTFPQEGKENKDFPSPLGRGQGEGSEQLRYFPAEFLRRWMDVQSRGARAVPRTGLVSDDPDCARWIGVLETAVAQSRKGKP